MSRDISDLKARLGLKKGGPASKKRGGGVVAPPGLKSKPSSVPVPPGAKPPAPVIPSASEDPFAAMNALAAVGAAQQAAKGPEIIVVNDGAPVEKVDTKSKAVTIGKYAGLVLIPLILGVTLGQISKSAKAVNRTIDEAGVLHKDVSRIRKGIVEIRDQLLLAKERGEGGASFKLNDAELTEALGAKKAFPAVDPVEAFRSYMFDMDKTLRSDILSFYSEATALGLDIEKHAVQAKADAKLMEKGAKTLVEAKPDPEVNEFLKKEFSRYGIYLEVPTRKEAGKGLKYGAQLVELGRPVCQDEKVSQTKDCGGGPPIGFAYRISGDAPGWELKRFGNPVGENVPGKKLIPLVQTPVLEQILKGSSASLAELGYLQRLQDIYNRTEELVKFGTSLEKTLKAKSNQSKSFTFFL